MYYITIVFVAVTILRSWLGFCMGLAPGRGEPVEANQLPPELDDEVQFSPHVPSKLSCESCAAIVHQVILLIQFHFNPIINPIINLAFRCHVEENLSTNNL